MLQGLDFIWHWNAFALIHVAKRTNLDVGLQPILLQNSSQSRVDKSKVTVDLLPD